MLKQTLLLLVCIFAVTSASFEEENHVMVLNKDTFTKAISTFQNVLVEFYAPWCGHCKKMEPEYAKAAEYFKQEGNKIRLAKVDATVEGDLAKEYGVNGFPTLLMFVDGQVSEYNGGRTANTIIGWIKKKVEIPSVYIEKLEDLETVVEKAEISVVFFGDEFDAAFKLYRKVASDNMEIPFFHTTSKEIKAKYHLNEENRVVMLRNFDERIVEFTDIFTSQNIEKFVMRNRFPKTVLYSQKYAKIIFGDGNPALFVMAGKGDSTEKAIEVAREVATELYGKVIVTFLDTEDEENEKVIKYFGLLREEVPSIFYFKPPSPTERPEKYLFQGRINKENILKFYKDYTEGKLESLPRSEEVPDKNDDRVKIVTSKTFRDIVHDEDKDVIVFYSSHDCAECKSFLAEFQGLATLVTTIEDLIPGHVDLDKNEIRGLKFDSLPQVLLYPRGQKDKPITYKGPKDVLSLFNFFKDSLTVKFDEGKIKIEETLKLIKKEAEEKAQAEEVSRRRMEELAASQKAKEEAEEAAAAKAKEDADKIAQENPAEDKKQANIDL